MLDSLKEVRLLIADDVLAETARGRTHPAVRETPARHDVARIAGEKPVLPDG